MSSPTLDRLATNLRNPSLNSGGTNSSIRTPDINLRYGKVVSYDPNSQLADVTIGGDTLILEDVEHLSNYLPTVGDDVWILVSGPNTIILDRTEYFGPSTWSQWGWGGDTDSTIRNLNDFQRSVDVLKEPTGNLISWNSQPTPAIWAYSQGLTISQGGSLWVNVGQSGVIVIGVSAYITPVADAGGTLTAGTGMCSVMMEPASKKYIVYPHPAFGVTYSGAVGTGARLSTIKLGGGLDPGPHRFSLQYAALDCYMGYALRSLWVLPL